ncbi:serine/threonine-protein kinase [Nannocystaceae bacterium ST9]
MSALPQLAPETGTVVGEGRFVLHEVLGEGGVARVYRADDLQLGRSVAIKLLIERYKGRPEREQRLLNEVAFLRRIGANPHVVGLVEGGRLRDCGGWPYVATELLSGKTLAQHRLTARSLPVQQVCLLAHQIAEGIFACHQAGVVHRDVTPGNLMLRQEPDGSRRITLFDFSHAAWTEGSKEPVGHPDRFTRELEVPGTPKYMAPEQARVEPASPAMDVYALGVVLWELITGENPFGRVHDRQEFIDLQRRGALETPRMMAWTYQIPEPLAAITNACLDPSPLQRPTMDAIRRQLAELLEPLDEAATETTATIAIPVREIERAQRSGVLSPLPPREEEATERRDVAALVHPPQRPAFAREHAALLASPLPELGPALPESSPDPGPLKGRSRFLSYLLIAVLLAGVAAWLISAQLKGAVGPEPSPRSVDPSSESDEPETSSAILVSPTVPTMRVSPPPTEPPGPPEPEVEPKPAPPIADMPRHQTPECVTIREEASAAIEANEWGRAETLTRQTKCWANPTERLRLRVEALAQAERYPECVRAGESSTDKEIKRWVKFCRSVTP